MERKNLVPWSWLKDFDVPPPSVFKNNDALGAYSDRNINRIFEDFVKDFGSFENRLSTFFSNDLSTNLKVLPSIDMSDTDKEYVIEADLPENCDSNKVDASFQNGILSVKVPKKEPAVGEVKHIKIAHKKD
jgi:HSP20 family molecular chaperone IbpA